MTKRQRALETIRIEVAETGCVGRPAIRAYVENRISRRAFDDATGTGMRQWRALHPGAPTPNCNRESGQ